MSQVLWIAKNLDVFDKGEAFNQGIAIAWDVIEERLVTV